MNHEKIADKLSNIRKGTHKSVDKVMDQAENINESSDKGMLHLKEKISTTKKDLEGYIQKNPEKSMLIATGIGLLAGATITAAFMKRK